MKTKILLFLLAVFTTGQCFASDFNDGTLNYTILSDKSGKATTNVQVDGFLKEEEEEDVPAAPPTPTTITIPATVTSNGVTYSVTSIGASAFIRCPGLTNLDLSKATNLTSIGESAFAGCSGLKTLDLSGPKSLAIGEGAFSNCTNTEFTTLTIPANVTSIGESAFWGCSSLTTVDLSNANALTTIGTNAFNNCRGMTTFTFPTKSTTALTIGDFAFENCNKLAALKPSANVTAINQYAFQSCTGLKTVDLSNATNLTSIGQYAFMNLRMKTLTLSGPTSLEIGQNAFTWNDSIKTLTIPANVTSIGAEAFMDCSGLETVDMDNATHLTSIGAEAFLCCYKLTTLKLGGATNLQTINSAAFLSCPLTGTLTIPAKVTTIGPTAFLGAAITKLDLSKAAALTSIGNAAFNGCEKLTGALTIPASVTTIGSAAFLNTQITGVTIPASVTSIGDGAFCKCTKLTSITLNNNTSFILDDNALLNKDKTTLIAYPAGNTASSYTIPATVTKIGDYAFNDCSSLTEITVPTSVTTIGVQAFDGTGWVKNMQPGVLYVNHIACLYAGTIPEDVKLDEGTTTIADNAFEGQEGLKSITIPASVTSIGNRAFENCSNLTTVLLEPTTPPTLGIDVFFSTSSALKFYVKDGTGTYDLTKYTSATNWSSFATKTFRYLPKTMTATKVATLYLPYEVAIPEGVTAYYCNGKSNTALGMKKLENEVIPANTPVYITSTNAGTFNFLGNGGTDAQPSDIDAALQGTSTDITNNSTTQSDYLALGEKTGSAPAEYGFYRFTGTTIDANTCYVAYSNEAKGLDLSFDGSVTGIKDITNSSSADDTNAPKVIYDLHGRRVNNPQHGIYIMNGKKVIIK